MGNNQTYEEIEYQLNDIQKLIDINSKDCTNNMKLDENIEISYDMQNDTPTIYRCPICLCIPFLYYNSSKITYICNCGTHICSLDYFFANFISYPINEINYKKSNNNNPISKFCRICSKFISEKSNHHFKYFAHSLLDIQNILIKSEKQYNVYSCYSNHLHKGYNYNYYLDNYFHSSNEILYSSFISKCLNFNIIKKIEDKYTIYQKIKFNDEKIKHNKKIYLFSRFLYYVFQINLSKNNLIFLILLNLYCVTLQLLDYGFDY